MASLSKTKTKNKDFDWLRCSTPKTLNKMASKRKEREDEAYTKQQNKQWTPTQKFREDYMATYPCIVRSALSQHHVRCTVCATDFIVSHGGMNNVKRHMGSKCHIDCGKFETRKISTFFADPVKVQQQDLDVIRAETLFSRFLVEHNIALSAADHAAELLKKCSPVVVLHETTDAAAQKLPSF